MKTEAFQIASVSDLVGDIKGHLEDRYQEVAVKGEVTNLSSSASGHWYFTLSDSNAALSCALFKMDAYRNSIIQKLKDGDEVILMGPLSVYMKRGSFQILVKKILPAGEGKLKLKFEMLKQKLTIEGLFEMERKRPLPRYPKKVAVITSETGAALQDFLKVYTRRAVSYNLVLIPSLVQGDQAAPSLVNALEKAFALEGVDVIVLTRGGGSLEDLWAFNDERLVRKIATSPVPVVSAIGHEVDFSLCDYVADLRCETPTAAAEILTQPQTEIKHRLAVVSSSLKAILGKQRELLQKYHPRNFSHLIQEKLNNEQMKLQKMHQFLTARYAPSLNEKNYLLDDYVNRLKVAMDRIMINYLQKLSHIDGILKGINPQQILKRGYTFITADNNNVVSGIGEWKKLTDGTSVSIHFHDGEVNISKTKGA